MSNKNDWIMKSRAAHHAALKAMLPGDDTRSGLQVWRQLRRLECKASQIATDLCNGTIEQEKADIQLEAIQGKVADVFGGQLPKGFFVNRDPRGYALKLEPGSVEHALHTDWERYQILAPEIE